MIDKVKALMANEKIKKTLALIFAVVMVVVFLVWSYLNPGPEHIEDTNGADNYALQQITEEDVVAVKMGSRGALATTEKSWDFGVLQWSNGVEYSCKKFTGVERLYSCTIFKGSDIYIYLADFYVESGNFAFYVVLDGEIIHTITPDTMGSVDCTIRNIEETGTLEYIIAGESANFSFKLPMDW